jgi:hypothetical protein
LQPAPPGRILDYLESISWVAALPEDRRAETLAKIGAIIRAGETPAELPVHVVVGLTSLE